MNKSLYAAFIKVCASRGKPLFYTAMTASLSGKCCPRSSSFIGPKTVHGVATSGFPKKKEVQDTAIGKESEMHGLLG
jgi:hypothetical protein